MKRPSRISQRNKKRGERTGTLIVEQLVRGRAIGMVTAICLELSAQMNKPQHAGKFPGR